MHATGAGAARRAAAARRDDDVFFELIARSSGLKLGERARARARRRQHYHIFLAALRALLLRTRRVHRRHAQAGGRARAAETGAT